jgi:hypothetical protein
MSVIPKEVRFWTLRKWRGCPTCERKPFHGRRDARPTIKQPRVEFLRAIGMTPFYAVCRLALFVFGFFGFFSKAKGAVIFS